MYKSYRLYCRKIVLLLHIKKRWPTVTEKSPVNAMDERGTSYSWDIIIETCFRQKTKLSVINSTSVRDLKVQCELEFGIPSDLQVILHENTELQNTTTMASLTSSKTQIIKTFQMHVVPWLEGFVSACMKGDIESVAERIQDKTNELLEVEELAFVAAFVSSGSRKRELLSSLLKSDKWFVYMNKRTQLSRRSLLHAAVAGGDLSCVVNVMTRGSLDLLYLEDEQHETPLDLARRLERTILVQRLEKYEENQREMKTDKTEAFEEEKTCARLEIIGLENTSNDSYLTSSENQNTKQKDQVSESRSTWMKNISLRNRVRGTNGGSTQDQKKNPNYISLMEKKDLEIQNLNDYKSHEALYQGNVQNDLSHKEFTESKTEKNEGVSSALCDIQQGKMTKTPQQRSKICFRNSSLKLYIPMRNKKKKSQDSISSERQRSKVHPNNATGTSEKTLANSTSPCKGTVPEIKIVKNTEGLPRDQHVYSQAFASERLSPTTKNLVKTQRPFSAHSSSVRSPTMQRMVTGRPRSSTMEKDRYSSPSPPRTSPPAGLCIPHPPVSPLTSSRRRSWSPAPELVAKLSPVLKRKFGSACDLERPRSGSFTTTIPSNQSPSQESAGTTLPIPDCKHFESLKYDQPLRSVSAPNSPQSSRKLLPLKINQELEVLHHRFFSPRERVQSLHYRRGSLPGNIWKDTNGTYHKVKESSETRHKQGKPFDIWLKEKQQQIARKHAFESAAVKAIENLADQTWSEIRSHGKTFEQWRREKDQAKSNRDSQSECNDAHHVEIHKKALKYEEWLKKKNEEDLKREEAIRLEAERQFEENRRKRENENERKLAKLKKHDN